MHNYLQGMNDEYLSPVVVKVDLYLESIEVELVYMIDLDLDFMLYMGSCIIFYCYSISFGYFYNVDHIKEFIYVL